MPLFPSPANNSEYPQRRRRILWLPIVLALGFALFQYFGAETVTLPETGKTVRVGLSSDQEQALGAQSLQEVLQTSEVVTSGPAVALVTKVAKRLVAVVDENSRNFEWAVSVIDSPEQNAFCLPGGKIVVYTGILPVTRTEDALAAVMGHELAHATLRHGSQRMLQQKLVQTAMMGAQVSMSDMEVGQKRVLLGVLGAGAQYGILLPYGRDHESEADEVGLRYMIRAGYDPYETIGFWERMAELSQSQQPPEFASTHPSHETRIDNIKRLIPVLLEQEKSKLN